MSRVSSMLTPGSSAASSICSDGKHDETEAGAIISMVVRHNMSRESFHMSWVLIINLADSQASCFIFYALNPKPLWVRNCKPQLRSASRLRAERSR